MGLSLWFRRRDLKTDTRCTADIQTLKGIPNVSPTKTEVPFETFPCWFPVRFRWLGLFTSLPICLIIKPMRRLVRKQWMKSLRLSLQWSHKGPSTWDWSWIFTFWTKRLLWRIKRMNRNYLRNCFRLNGIPEPKLNYHIEWFFVLRWLRQNNYF